MKLYLVEIATDHLKYKYSSDDLNLYILYERKFSEMINCVKITVKGVIKLESINE